MEFVIATHNAHKVEEFNRILKPLGITAVTADLSEVDETGTTFSQNAYLKAEAACRETGKPAIADDSGLSICALGLEPGVYSARYAEPGHRREKVLNLLRDVPDEKRGAYFTSAICCVFPNGRVLRAEGVCLGQIAHGNRGEGGFGYDPIFEVGDKTFAEMSGEEKDAVSHRGIALRAFAEQLEKWLQEGVYGTV